MRLTDCRFEREIGAHPPIRYVADRPDYARTLENASGLNATLLAMTTLHMAHFRDQYRNELSPRALAWLFFNMAVATTTRYIESDDPIQLDELRSGLKFASAGLLAAGRQQPPQMNTDPRPAFAGFHTLAVVPE